MIHVSPKLNQNNTSLFQKAERQLMTTLPNTSTRFALSSCGLKQIRRSVKIFKWGGSGDVAIGDVVICGGMVDDFSHLTNATANNASDDADDDAKNNITHNNTQVNPNSTATSRILYWIL